MFSAAKTEMLT